MKYEKIVKGNFIERPNRFIARVLIDGREETAHVKNTGRCKELLTHMAQVDLEDFAEHMGTRKMRYSLINVKKGNRLINMDSQAPNKVCEEALISGKISLPGMGKLTVVQREKTFGDSRFDFHLQDEWGQEAWLEVKGVTLEEKNIARFPDAPTERGVKHVNELRKAVVAGYKGYILFVIQMEGIECFHPNDETHKAFGDVLRLASEEGVNVLAYDCKVTQDTLEVNKEIPVKL